MVAPSEPESPEPAFRDDVRRPNRDNAIDVYISDDYEDVLADGIWQDLFTEKPQPLTREEKKAWIAQLHGVALGSDAFFPFGDNIERLIAAASTISPRPAARSATTMSSKRAINMELPWP